MYVPGEQGRGLAVPTEQWCPIQQTSPGKKILKGSVCYRSTNSHARLFCWGYEPSDSQTTWDWDWVGKKTITLQSCKRSIKRYKTSHTNFFICRRSSDHRKKCISLKSKSSFDCSAWKNSTKGQCCSTTVTVLTSSTVCWFTHRGIFFAEIPWGTIPSCLVETINSTILSWITPLALFLGT